MTHDIDDLLEIIKALEERILQLETKIATQRNPQLEDAWYWEHG